VYATGKTDMTDDVSSDDYAVSMQAGDKHAASTVLTEASAQPRLLCSSRFQFTVPNHNLISVDANNLRLVKQLTEEHIYTLSLCENLLKCNCGLLRFMGTIIFILNMQQLSSKLYSIVNKVTINVKRIHHRK
jgi:hypothetical protein